MSNVLAILDFQEVYSKSLLIKYHSSCIIQTPALENVLESMNTVQFFHIVLAKAVVILTLRLCLELGKVLPGKYVEKY